MVFQPPRCPHADCPSVQRALPASCCRKGRYRRRCDGRLIQRFRCHHCRRDFSVQSFRVDKGLRKSWLCRPVVELLCAKVSLRRIAEVLGVRRPTVERRLDRYGAHAGELHGAFLERCRSRGPGLFGELVLDELETFVEDRTVCPVTVPLLVEPRSFFVVHVDTAPMASRGGLTVENEARKQARRAREGVRRSGSDAAVRRALLAWRGAQPPGQPVLLTSDEKPAYLRLFRQVFRRQGRHRRISSKRRRDRSNPLFVVNMTFAMLRDGLGRLVRRSWGHSRRTERLGRHLWLWVLFRNYVRERTRRDRRTTPALSLGVVDRRFRLGEVLRWRAPFAELLFAR